MHTRVLLLTQFLYLDVYLGGRLRNTTADQNRVRSDVKGRRVSCHNEIKSVPTMKERN